jgi:hypothetical protein
MKTLLHRTLLLPCGATVALTLGLCALNAHGASTPVAPPSRPAPVVQTAPQQQAVPPSPATPTGDIIDIRGPIHIPAAFPWLQWSASAAGTLALGFGAWAFFRRPRRKWPYEIALAKLEATRPLMAEDNAQPFSLAVSGIVRLFIEECLPVRAAHHTTHEFLRYLLNLPDSPLADHRESLANFLEHCDLAKFARWSLTIPQMESMLASASAFVVAIGKPKAVKKQTAPAKAASTQAPEPVTANS